MNSGSPTVAKHLCLLLCCFYELGDFFFFLRATFCSPLQSGFDGCFQKHFISVDAFNLFKVAATAAQLVLSEEVFTSPCLTYGYFYLVNIWIPLHVCVGGWVLVSGPVLCSFNHVWRTKPVLFPLSSSFLHPCCCCCRFDVLLSSCCTRSSLACLQPWKVWSGMNERLCLIAHFNVGGSEQQRGSTAIKHVVNFISSCVLDLCQARGCFLDPPRHHHHHHLWQDWVEMRSEGGLN